MSEAAHGEIAATGAAAGKVRLAIVGTGGVANAHVRAHRRNSDLVEIVALSDVVPGKAEEFTARHGLVGARCCGHYDEVLALPEVEAVDVCTRPDAHAPAAIAALAAGKHVLCEKPMATSVAEARRMLDAANASACVNMVDFTYRYFPGARFIRSLIDAGELGEILRVRAEYLRDLITPPLGGWSAGRRRPDPTDPAANIVGDLGSHMIDLARFLGGEIERISGQYRIFGDYDESAIITVSFASGAVGSLETTSVATGRGPDFRRIEVHGTKGAATFWFSRPSQVEVYTTTGATYYSRGFVTVPVPGIAYTEDDYESWLQGMTSASQIFAEAIRRGEKARADFGDGYVSNLVMEAAFQSSRTGQTIDLRTFVG